MRKFSLDALAREHVARAEATSSGRSAETVYGGHECVLRQTLLALTAGASLTEHDNPDEATLLVLRGRVRMAAGNDSWEGRDGDLLIVPEGRHNLVALENAVVILTVAKVQTPGG